MPKRIVITGPESTGKSWLAKQLALKFHTHFVPEYAREYLLEHGLEYNEDDVEAIAKGQLEREDKLATKTDLILFCDTGLLVPKIWSEVVFETCPRWIDDQFHKHNYDLYLLCYPDIPWEYDPMRENPENRKEIFVLYETALKKAGYPYHIVTGLGADRLENALTFVKEIL
jgi:NadR type nicotinamide-nucleotide adenylyltransferase